MTLTIPHPAWAEATDRMLSMSVREVMDVALHAGWGEAWGVWDSDGSANGPWQVQKVDDPDYPEDGYFEEDDQVWEILYARYLLGDFEAICVMAFLSVANPQEYNAILRHEGETDGLLPEPKQEDNHVSEAS